MARGPMGSSSGNGRRLMVLHRLIGCVIAMLLSAPAGAQEIKVTLLGTGAPIPLVDRQGPATLIEAGGKRLLFDAGRGVSQRLWQLKKPLSSIDAVFLTHLHSDHLVGLPDLWLTGWLQPEYGRRQTPLRLIGPHKTSLLAQSLKAGFAPDIAYRSEKEGLPTAGIDFSVTEIGQAGAVFEEAGLRVTAFEVDHGVVKPAYGYRIDFGGKSVVISGDTTFTPTLVEQARGVDLLVHEIVAAAPALRGTAFVQRQFEYHSSPQSLARTLREARPKATVLTHFVLLGNAANPPPTPDSAAAEVRAEGYDGPLVAGVDLMEITVGAGVTIQAPTPPPIRP